MIVFIGTFAAGAVNCMQIKRQQLLLLIYRMMFADNVRPEVREIHLFGTLRLRFVWFWALERPRDSSGRGEQKL